MDIIFSYDIKYIANQNPKITFYRKIYDKPRNTSLPSSVELDNIVQQVNHQQQELQKLQQNYENWVIKSSASKSKSLKANHVANNTLDFYNRNNAFCPENLEH